MIIVPVTVPLLKHIFATTDTLSYAAAGCLAAFNHNTITMITVAKILYWMFISTTVSKFGVLNPFLSILLMSKGKNLRLKEQVQILELEECQASYSGCCCFTLVNCDTSSNSIVCGKQICLSGSKSIHEVKSLHQTVRFGNVITTWWIDIADA